MKRRRRRSLHRITDGIVYIDDLTGPEAGARSPEIVAEPAIDGQAVVGEWPAGRPVGGSDDRDEATRRQRRVA